MVAKKRCFRIDDNPVETDGARYVLIDDSDTIVRVGDRVRTLADVAFDLLGADEVRHDEDLVKAEFGT